MNSLSSSRKRGFTLIEVLLVLVILVVLASLAVVAYGPVKRKAAINQAKAQIGLFKTALSTYENLVGSYPSTASGLQALRSRPADIQDPSKWDGPYLDSDVPLDPWGKPYSYTCPGNHNPDSYDVWTVTPPPDNQEIGNWSSEGPK